MRSVRTKPTCLPQAGDPLPAAACSRTAQLRQRQRLAALPLAPLAPPRLAPPPALPSSAGWRQTAAAARQMPPATETCSPAPTAPSATCLGTGPAKEENASACALCCNVQSFGTVEWSILRDTILPQAHMDPQARDLSCPLIPASGKRERKFAIATTELQYEPCCGGRE